VQKVRAFSLVELLVVVILIGVMTFTLVRLPSWQKSALQVEDLYDLLYPQGEIIVFEDSIELHSERDVKGVTLALSHPEVFRFVEGRFERVDFAEKNGRKILFRYRVHRGLGDYFILVSDQGFYVFKPLGIYKTDAWEKAKELFLLAEYAPEAGGYH